jgi:polyisoprenoid-binding protein YceI
MSSSTRTTDRPPTAGRPRRRRLWIALAVVVVVLVVAAVVGPRIYANSESGKAAAPLVSTGATPSATATGAATDPTLDGPWTIASGGTAGYRVNEVLNGQKVTVTGRTDEVTGDLTVADGRLTTGTVTVDLASVATDSSQRDRQFRGMVMDTDTYPTADFALTQPVPLGGLDVGSTISVGLVGTMTLKGTTKDVTIPASVQRTAQDAVTITGSLPLTWSDYGVSAPNLGFVSVEDTGTIEFSFGATTA